jgi:hypothetical protein
VEKPIRAKRALSLDLKESKGVEGRSYPGKWGYTSAIDLRRSAEK